MNRIKRWKEWRKDSPTTLWYQFLVLIGIKYDIGFEITFTEEETMRLVDNIRRFESSKAFEDDGK